MRLFFKAGSSTYAWSSSQTLRTKTVVWHIWCHNSYDSWIWSAIVTSTPYFCAGSIHQNLDADQVVFFDQPVETQRPWRSLQNLYFIPHFDVMGYATCLDDPSQGSQVQDLTIATLLTTHSVSKRPSGNHSTVLVLRQRLAWAIIIVYQVSKISGERLWKQERLKWTSVKLI